MINYEGVNYNIDVIIQFQALQQLLEALAKKQINHNILLYGPNNNIVVGSDEGETNEENNNDKKKDNIENNNNNYFSEKINNFGLLKEFIESQKQLAEHKKIIDELIHRIENLEKERDIGKEKEKDKEKDIEKKREKEIKVNENLDNKKELSKQEREIKNKDNIDDNNDKKDKKDNIDINDLNNNISETDDNLNKDNLMVEAENQQIKNIDTKEENFIKTQTVNFEESLKLINEKIE